MVFASDFEDYLDGLQVEPLGCFVDTNLLFAADYDTHRLFEEAVKLGETILKRKIPIFSNATIRSELLELKRRVLIGEALLDFLAFGQKYLPISVFNALKSLKTSTDKAVAASEHYLLGDRKIKGYRNLFEEQIGPGAWRDFCSKFIGDKLQSEWTAQVDRKGVNYLDGRPSGFLTGPVEWEDTIALIETYGIGTSDAMIVNIFLKSVLPFMVTADSDVAYCMASIESDKVIVVPDALDFPGRSR